MILYKYYIIIIFTKNPPAVTFQTAQPCYKYYKKRIVYTDSDDKYAVAADKVKKMTTSKCEIIFITQEILFNNLWCLMSFFGPFLHLGYNNKIVKK